MKKALAILTAAFITLALAGCNIAPNVMPYVTNSTYGTPYGNRTPTYKNGVVVPSNTPLVKSGVNPADKYILPGAGSQ